MYQPLLVAVLNKAFNLSRVGTLYFLLISSFTFLIPMLITSVLLVFNLSAQYCKSSASAFVSLKSSLTFLGLSVSFCPFLMETHNHFLSFDCTCNLYALIIHVRAKKVNTILKYFSKKKRITALPLLYPL